MLTYDDVWTSFLDNYHVDDIDLPNDEEIIYRNIKNAVDLFNNRLRKMAIADNDSETISGVESNDDKIIIAAYIRLVIIRGARDFYERLLQGYEGDVGFKNFSAQLVSIRESVKEQELKISELIFNTRENFL